MKGEILPSSEIFQAMLCVPADLLKDRAQGLPGVSAQAVQRLRTEHGLPRALLPAVWLSGESFNWLLICFLLGGLLYVEPGLDMFSDL